MSLRSERRRTKTRCSFLSIAISLTALQVSSLTLQLKKERSQEEKLRVAKEGAMADIQTLVADRDDLASRLEDACRQITEEQEMFANEKKESVAKVFVLSPAPRFLVSSLLHFLPLLHHLHPLLPCVLDQDSHLQSCRSL